MPGGGPKSAEADRRQFKRLEAGFTPVRGACELRACPTAKGDQTETRVLTDRGSTTSPSTRSASAASSSHAGMPIARATARSTSRRRAPLSGGADGKRVDLGPWDGRDVLALEDARLQRASLARGRASRASGSSRRLVEQGTTITSVARSLRASTEITSTGRRLSIVPSRVDRTGSRVVSLCGLSFEVTLERAATSERRAIRHRCSASARIRCELAAHSASSRLSASVSES